MSTSSFVNLGTRLQEARLRLSLTQAEVAIRAGVSSPAVTNWETNKNVPSKPKLSRLAEALDVAPEWLMGDTDDPTPSMNQKIRAETPMERDRDRFSRPRVSMHQKTLEKAEFLQEELGCLTVEEVVAKLVNDRFDQIPGATPEPEHIPVRYAGMATTGHKPPEEDEDDEVYDVDMTKPRKPR